MNGSHSDEIISYDDLCLTLKGRIQKGINIRYRGKQTILLMSQRKNAPYPDKFDPVKGMLTYVGHDVRKTNETPIPKNFDQPLLTEKGTPSDNAKLIEFVCNFKKGSPPEVVRIFEKIQNGIWYEKGEFQLVDYREEFDGKRRIFIFDLKAIPSTVPKADGTDFEHNRFIPTEVKVEVYKRDGGRCVLCDSTENLHFDHELPFSKGGTSLLPQNIRILCAKCNLKKGARIE